jgi:hypothetical protein
MKNIFFLLISVSMVLTTACNNDLITSPIIPQKAVVEAYLSPNRPMDVLITKELPFSDTTTQVVPITNLVVKIQYDATTITLKSNGDGHYLSDVKVDSNKTYRLFFDYGGKTLEATTTIPAKPTGFSESVTEIKITQYQQGGGGGFGGTQPDPLKLAWNNPNNDYFFVVAHNTENYPEEINIRPAGVVVPNRQFRSRPQATSAYEIRPRQFVYYGHHDMILYRINGEYASLYDDTGSNSLNLTAPYTNVKNGLGIFTGVSADTLKFLVSKP